MMDMNDPLMEMVWSCEQENSRQDLDGPKKSENAESMVGEVETIAAENGIY